MKFRNAVLVSVISLAAMSPAAAGDSVERGSTASLGASLVAGSVAGWAVYEGSELTVKAIHASRDGAVLVLQGASGALETSARVSGEAAQAARVAIGTSVTVVAESTGYALMGSGVLLAFAPNEIGRTLLYSTRHERGAQ